ncbi:DEAD/DEAH box helicase [Arsenicicoccus dermatophilus]|uniref:DEAD/DEAH box helicase n=1 Tax=Arsenicicoccus dermatophilus TaxID=1076331 RepID=UPI003916D55B
MPRHPHLDDFCSGFAFPLDDFQLEACAAVEDGHGVLVAAPTGAGKTIVGEFGVHLALATGRKAFYTTPIKALSNQKFHDLVARHGADRVGLLTGDSSVNGEAPVVVMTTEVLRNMLYAGSSSLHDLGVVVMDEVHYLADRFRGAVWEEVIIHLPEAVQVISLSATVSNAEEFGAWLGEVRGDTAVVVSEHRPVPLWQHMMVGRELFDLFVDAGGSVIGKDRDSHHRITAEMAKVNPDLVQRLQSLERGAWGAGRGPRSTSRANDPWGSRGRGRGAGTAPAGGSPYAEGGTRGSRPGGAASRAEVIARLERDGLLPAITFIFSRAGCEAAVAQLLAQDVRLVPADEGARIRRLVEERVAGVGDGDLGVLGHHDFVEALSRGYAAHHAGMLPTFREIVEELFTAGRIRAVFATETLALGINMPARTVVLEKLVKFNGDAHVELSPAEYTQLTGRAGRRGIDVEGHAVVVWSRGVDPLAVGGLAATRTYPLNSSFRPTYNMAVNLVRRVGRQDAREILETSFAQFQADRAVVGLAAQVRRNDEALAGYREAMTCHLGDFAEYSGFREQIRHLEKSLAKERSSSRRAAIEQSLADLREGDVFAMREGRHTGMAIVVNANTAARGNPPTPLVVNPDGRARRLTVHDVDQPIEPTTNIALPRNFNARNTKMRKDIASTVRAKVPYEAPRKGKGRAGADGSAGEQAIESLRRRMKAHPCHQCPDREDHARWAERYHRLDRETAGLRRRVSGRTNSVAKQFDRICDLLAETGYLDARGETVTPSGAMLRRLYSEKDLLAAECLSHGVWQRLDVPSLAAVVSALIYEPRQSEADGGAPRVPNQDVSDAYHEMVRLWSVISDHEARHQLPETGAPDGGMMWPVHRWAAGQTLEVCLRDSDMAAGDFVRRCKQIVDLLGQIATCAPQPALAATARQAIDAVMRGVVAADRLD